MKKNDNYDHEKKTFIIRMSNKTPEIMTKQHRYHEKCKEKGTWYYEENKEGLQKCLIVNREDHLKKKKDQKREKMQEISSRMCLKRTGKNYEKEAKIKLQYVLRRITTRNRTRNRTDENMGLVHQKKIS